MTGTDLWTMAVILGLACITVLTRCFFFILDRAWTLPGWAERALQYAPVAALAGVIAPEVVMAGGQLVGTWRRQTSGCSGRRTRRPLRLLSRQHPITDRSQGDK